MTAFADADLVVMNGLGLDDWVVNLMSDAGSEAPVLVLAEDLPGADTSPATRPGSANPHLWLNVAYAIGYVDRIESGARGRGSGRGRWLCRSGRMRIAAELSRPGRHSSASELAAIPEAQRRVVSFHDAFPYFAAAYGLEVVGTVVEAPGQDPSAGQVTALIDDIRHAGVSAILSEASSPPTWSSRSRPKRAWRWCPTCTATAWATRPATRMRALIRWDVERISEALR